MRTTVAARAACGVALLERWAAVRVNLAFGDGVVAGTAVGFCAWVRLVLADTGVEGAPVPLSCFVAVVADRVLEAMRPAGGVVPALLEAAAAGTPTAVGTGLLAFK